MSRYIIILATLLLLGCHKKQMQLPQVEDVEITSVEDYSQVYISYEEPTGEAKLNANGLISSTNWVLHVDKRNKLSKVAPLFIKLQEKRTNPPLRVCLNLELEWTGLLLCPDAPKGKEQ